MPIDPANQDELYEDLRNRIIGRTEKLTNFEEGSLNHTLAYYGFAGYFQQFEHALLAAQFAGWIETAGGPVTEDDLIRLDIPPERVDLDLLNSFMQDEDLEQLALQNGVTRDPGSKARGEVVFMTVDDTITIPKGTKVMTAPDEFSSSAQREYVTIEETSPDPGTTGATAVVEAVDVGPNYNVGAGTVTEMPSPPAGVRDVTNQVPITGGEPPETNDELRERAKAAITQRSGGGTAEGIKGGIVELVDGVDEDDVFIEEHYNPTSGPPYAEVTVDGGTDRDVEEAIDLLHPTAIKHILNRPTEYLVDTTVELSGAPINVERVESEISRYYSERGLGENINRAGLIQAIMNADADIENVDTLELWNEEIGPIEGDLALDPDEKAEAGEISVSGNL